MPSTSLRNRAISLKPNVVFVSAHAKCKVPIGKPNYPVAAVARGKKVIVGLQERFKLSDHDFTKVSVIPDAVLIHDIPDVENGESHGNGEDEIFDGIEEGKSKPQGWYLKEVQVAGVSQS